MTILSRCIVVRYVGEIGASVRTYLRDAGAPVVGILVAVLLAIPVSAQRYYNVEKPKERSTSDTVRVRTTVRPAASRGILVVLVEPILPGQIVIRDAAGREVSRQEADKENGQAEFSLPRGSAYQIEASFPGYTTNRVRSRPLTEQTFTRIRLVAESAVVKLRDLPPRAEIMIDGQLRAAADESGGAVVSGILPGRHKLRITHPEYNEYEDGFEVQEAGEVVSYPRVPMTRVARLEITGPAGATVLIEGAVMGKINADGMVRIDYELAQEAERTISVELLGYQTWSSRERLSPGPRSLSVRLDPVVTSAGVTDFFDSLTQWKAPMDWRIVGDARNKRLEVRGAATGTLRDKIYRDLQANFTVWLPEGVGATWMIKPDGEARNYYLFHISGPGAKTRTPRRFYSYIVRDGAAPIEVGTPVPLLVDLAARASYTINITVSDFTIQHSITSNETGETNDLGVWTDTTQDRNKFIFGSFGFCTLAGESFLVDDFNLEPIKSAARTDKGQ